MCVGDAAAGVFGGADGDIDEMGKKVYNKILKSYIYLNY